GELKDRIRKELRKAIDNKKDKEGKKYNDEQVFLLKDALRISGNAPIFTIHSFCQTVLREAAFLAKVPVVLEMTDDNGIKDALERKLRSKYVADFLKNYASGSGIADLLDDNKGLIDILAKAGEEYYLDKNGKAVPDIIELVNERFDYDGIPMHKKFIGDKIGGAYKDWLYEKQYARLQSFNDMIRNLREAICSGSKKEGNLLIRYLRSKYQIAIIDEFQDTNQKQWDIFKEIFLDKKKDSEKHGKHSLVVVGDPKQSIYSFHGADVEVYSKAKEEFDGRHDCLKVNYRSSNGIIEACNKMFGEKYGKDFFSSGQQASRVKFTNSSSPRNPDDKSQEAKWQKSNAGYEFVKPVWLATKDGDGGINEYEFARFAAAKIKECCNGVDKVHGPLQIYDKDIKRYRSVNYSDFAILCRVRTELPPIISELDGFGIPYVKYKDDKLFAGKECADWIAILEAINTDDFAGSGRKVLQKALFSEFFHIPLNELDDANYDYPECEQRVSIQIWRRLAGEENWFELIDSIFNRSKIEFHLNSAKDQSALFKYRQIGDYIQLYLVSEKGGLKNCIGHLKGLNDSKGNGEAEEDDGNIVGIGTDSECVRIMTIHASKGLEFPVVISVAGWKSKNNTVVHCWQGHVKGQEGCELPTGKFIDIVSDKEFTKTKLYKDRKAYGYKGDSGSFKDDYCTKSISDREQWEEFKRLFYVDFTRAGSLLILPYYKHFDGNNFKFNFKFVKDAIDNIKENSCFVEKFCVPNSQRVGNTDGSNGSKGRLNEPNDGDEERFSTTQSNVDSALSRKHSYSSLKDMFSNGAPDRNAFHVLIPELYDGRDNNGNAMGIRGGTLFGTALHEVFEKCDFSHFSVSKDENYEKNRKENCEYVRRILSRNGFFSLGSRGDNDRIGFIADMVCSSLNASLPRIRGSIGPSGPDDTFALSGIDRISRIAEAEFLFNAGEDGAWMRQYCDGFMDLLFIRRDNDGNRYCILDWKSDKLEQGKLYSDPQHLKERVDADYSVQRVLYSYCLVRWLSSMYSIHLNDAFDKYFGGIYYVFARGTVEGTSNGIYAQTWTSFEDLRSAYSVIRNRITHAHPIDGNEGE
ncbi:MAG TPA: hypothetical protein DCO86_05060, partial [Spirochaetaceae bacterium]|nr:hypothetical protein [Spirochaetaceae bacterium]